MKSLITLAIIAVLAVAAEAWRETAEKKDALPVSLPAHNKVAFENHWNTQGYVSAQGTWKAENGKEKPVLETSSIICEKASKQCSEAIAGVDENGKLYGDLGVYTILSTTGATIQVFTRRPCQDTTLTLNMRTEEVTAVSVFPKEGKSDCPDAGQPPRTMHLVSGGEIEKDILKNTKTPILNLLSKSEKAQKKEVAEISEKAKETAEEAKEKVKEGASKVKEETSKALEK